MPIKMERAIIRTYRRKGYSLKRSRSIAYATMNKRGMLKQKRKRAKAKKTRKR